MFTVEMGRYTERLPCPTLPNLTIPPSFIAQKTPASHLK